MKEDNWNLLIDLVSKKTGIKKKKLNPTTKIGSDLKIDGDDAIELFEEIKSKFGINLYKIDVYKIFSPENDLWDIKNYYLKLFKPDRYFDRNKHDLSLEELLIEIESELNII